MATTGEPRPEMPHETKPAPAAADSHGDAQALHIEPPPQQPASSRPAAPAAAAPATSTPRPHPLRRAVLLLLFMLGLAAAGYFLYPRIVTAMNTVSTDDAYVNSHVTFVAPRVAGQVSQVLVDDNYRVKRGDVLVVLDKEPYQVQVNISQAAVDVANAALTEAQAQVRGLIAQARASRFKLAHAIEDVNNQIANLRAAVATFNSRKATLALAQANLRRGEELAPTGGLSKENLDERRETMEVAKASVDQALQAVYAIRVGLGLTEDVPQGHELAEVPPNLDQDFSAVRQALGELLQNASQFGYMPATWTASPKEAIEAFYKQDPEGNLDRIYAHIIPNAPTIKQAEARLMQAQRNLDQAKLNLCYCEVVSEIDGVVTRRNVNPGNNVAVGENLMAVRSLTEIWIDANFKETQLAELRIGQRVRCEVDMYGRRREYEGRITGFTMGTGQTLSLLPPQNATGNFVKIVQRLPVRIELTDYDPEKQPLFVGLSVVPYVYYKEPASGPHAGAVLQPLTQLPTAPVEPKP
ncbi:MAG TPA: HlyD family secretion protein [Pirellulales bacterium]|jgi:membrane fusion protein (multidrug efflux system)|nr:HlyD family secretion protein [Pirellulales bacterium]